ncbi:MAG TPA: YkvA family protein [Anaerolineales bacterium]|nr:YkvA family protein [Anaerolineales bacterium]
MFEKLRARAQKLKNEAYAIYLAAKDPRTPWYAKALIYFVVAHTFSPIDLIPDFIPVLGYLDDLIITPLGIALAVRLIPAEVLAEARLTVATQGVARGVGLIGAGIIIIIWILAIIWGATIILRLVENT